MAQLFVVEVDVRTFGVIFIAGVAGRLRSAGRAAPT
jgi:hypothetical protein